MPRILCSLASFLVLPVAPLFAQTAAVAALDTAVTPQAIAVDSAGNVFVGDIGTWQIRRIDAASGAITNAGAGLITIGSSDAMAFDNAGNLFIADGQGFVVRRIDAVSGRATVIAGGGRYDVLGDGGPATGAFLDHPFGVAVDRAGDVYIAEWGAHRVRKVSARTGLITTVAGDGSPTFSGDGGPATEAGLPNPSGVAVDAAGNLYIAEWANNNVNRVRMVDANTGIITTLAGNGHCGNVEDGVAATAEPICGPYALALGKANDLYVVDIYHRAYRIALDTKTIISIAGSGSGVGGAGFSGDGGPGTQAALDTPQGIAVDAQENVYIADTRNNRVRKVDVATGTITTIAGNGAPSRPDETRRRVVGH